MAVGDNMTPFDKIREYIDVDFREKVLPIPGSIVYFEKYGQCIGSGVIGTKNNIIVLHYKNKTKSQILSFEYDDILDEKDMRIYMSANRDGVIGSDNLAKGAEKHIFDIDLYNYNFKNSHEFVQKVLAYVDSSGDKKINLMDVPLKYNVVIEYEDEEVYREFVIKNEYLIEKEDIFLNNLRKEARDKLGVTKWLLWDYKNKFKMIPEPNINLDLKEYSNMQLNENTLQSIRIQREVIMSYLNEIRDESIPEVVLIKADSILASFDMIEEEYDELQEVGEDLGTSFSSNDSKRLNLLNLEAVVYEMKHNEELKNMIEKLGREFISKEENLNSSEKIKVYDLNDEVYGIEKSDNITRVLPNEVVNLVDEDLEYLFYAKYFEKSLLSYEISGDDEKRKKSPKIENGPVIMLLDTSGSMFGKSMRKAKALALATIDYLKEENRNLYILIFGGKGEVKEKEHKCGDDIKKTLKFLNKGFGVSTDFEEPLKRSIEILEESGKYKKADIFMVSDGACVIDEDCKEYIQSKKEALQFNIYTVITVPGNYSEDGFSDEVVRI